MTMPDLYRPQACFVKNNLLMSFKVYPIDIFSEMNQSFK